VRGIGIAFVAIVLCACRFANAQVADLTKPFEPDKETICLFHLDDVATGKAEDAVPGGTSGKVVDAKEAEGKFGKAMSADGTKGWVDVTGLRREEGIAALTAECWVKFRDAARGDLVCRSGQYMIRVADTVNAYFWLDGEWRIVQGSRQVPVGRWTHLAITWQQAKREVRIYVDGQLDVAQMPQGVTDGTLGMGDDTLRLGNHTWQSGAAMLDGDLDEVRVSSVARQYKPLPGAEATPAAQRRPEAAAPAAAAAAPMYVEPFAASKDPTDLTKTHVQEITAGTQKYTVVQGGTMDGRSCRSPMGCGISMEGAFFQTWESNRSVRMENVGDTDVINPWLSNGRNNFRNVGDIVSSAVVPGMTDAEKAFALWFQEIQQRHHAGGDNNELGDPVKVFNIYGYNTCGNDSIALGTLWKKAGFKTAPARALGHCISQAFYDGRWHFFDGDMHSVYLLRDNQTVASDQDIARDHDLVKRTHSKGILLENSWWSGQGMCSMYFYEGEIKGERAGKGDTTMDMVLRPGEALVWRWGQYKPVKYHGMLQTMPTYAATICDGLWEYRPDFTKETWRKGATVENVVSGPDGLAAEEGKTGTITWEMRSPYVFAGGRIEAEGDGAKFTICQDGKNWRPVQDNMDRLFSIVGPPYYAYQVKCQLDGGARLKKLAIVNDVQMAPLALPEMGVGQNAFTYSDQTEGARKVRITHNWVERSATRPPDAPAAAVSPTDGGETNGTDVVFQWAVPAEPDGDAISDYQFELSPRADMRIPLSMDFYKLISRTDDATRTRDNATGKWTLTGVKAQYTVPQVGLLTPDQKYYWHVRAQDAKGVWGPWSKTWSFTARGPAYPVEVTLDYDQAKGAGVLRWKPNILGRTPAKYRVYGSDEKGFTIGDKAYQGTIGISKEDMSAWNPWFPANFIAETTGTELAVIGLEVTNAAANKTYYRVVAVDDQGKLSGPSDYATAPRPVIYSKPAATAKVGEEYKYQVRANRSLGDLSARMKGSDQVSGYFDIEKPKFALAQGPAWLKLDEATGLLSGTPNGAGKAEVVLTATIERQVRKLDESKLIWGNEKIISEDPEQVGVATQKFVIAVQ